MDYRKEYEKWLASPALSEDERAELKALEGNDKEIKARFYGPLEFGTAGLRGTMYTGLHNMNRHVIRWATQGVADVIAAEGDEAKKKGVAICMDCRVHSMDFARAAAEVCAANGIRVRMFESLRPTPELSFAVRYYGCQAGINVTASHNPKEYNGYKVYWADGAQLPPQHAAAIADELTRIDIFTGVRFWARRRTRCSWPTSWLWSTTAAPSRRWPTPSKWSTPPSTAAAGSWCRRLCGVWA